MVPRTQEGDSPHEEKRSCGKNATAFEEAVYRHIWAFEGSRRLALASSLSPGARTISFISETAPATRVCQPRPKRGGRPAGPMKRTDYQRAGLPGRFRFAGAFRAIEQLRVVGGGSFPEPPHGGQNLSLCVQTSVSLVASASSRGPVGGLYLVFVLPSEGFLYGSVTEGLQFSVSCRIELFPLNLIAAARTFLDSELAIPPELLLCSEPTGRLDKGVEGVSIDRRRETCSRGLPPWLMSAVDNVIWLCQKYRRFRRQACSGVRRC